MTGRDYYRTGILHTSRGGAKMAGDEVTIAELLSKNGYKTGLFGKWHLGDNYPMRPQDQGFDEVLQHKAGGLCQTPDLPNSYFDPIIWENGKEIRGKGYCTDVFFEGVFEFIEQNQKQPFFTYIATNAPHEPLQVDDKYVKPYLKSGLEKETAKVYGMIENIDENIGLLFEHLNRLDLEDNTIVIFMTDDGPASSVNRYNAGLQGGKGSVYEGGVRVPFFIRWPKHLKAGRKISQITSHTDIVPTLLDAASVSKPDSLHLDGVNLMPLLKGKDKQNSWIDRTLCFQCHRGLTPQRYQNMTAISQRFKLIGYPDTLGNDSDIFKTSDTNPYLELYNIEEDPGEVNNLAEKYPEIVKKLKREYDIWFEDVKSTRQFKPGVIHIGNKAENPLHLCRYMDTNYHLGLPHGWNVEVEREGHYEISINRGNFTGPGELVVNWKGKTIRKPLKEGQNTESFKLYAGRGILEVWFELEDIGRITFSDNGVIGDVDIRLCND